MKTLDSKEKLELLIHLINDLSGVETEADLIKQLLAGALEFTNAERAFWVEKENEDYFFTDIEGQHIEFPKVSTSSINNVFASGKPLCLIENAEGQSIPPTASILALDLKTIMCSPLTFETDGKQTGVDAVLYVDSRVGTRPFDRNDLDVFTTYCKHAAFIRRHLLLNKKLKQDYKLLHQEVRSKYDYHRIVGQCKEMQQVYENMEMLKDTDIDVMITGETGTGKELIAKAVHYASRRSDAAFKQINCAALPEGLVEAELFGVERNVATEVRRRSGKLEQAHGGSLFLDEIGDMPVRIQNRLLRFLEARKFRRIGGREEIHSDVRVIAATNKDIAIEIKSGRFRDALHYRLNIVNIHLPPLKDRGEDLELLANFFLKEVVDSHQIDIKGFTADAWKIMKTYNWPGNVRELKHRVQSAAFLAKGHLIEVSDLGIPKALDLSIVMTMENQKMQFEKELIKRALERHHRDRNKVARSLGISLSTLMRKMKKYVI
ncbi:sigma-54-dependent Fis family transcriptional regulator, partial [bacterium]|nr:sigma-54-dependent Fis family transcriptional regulator [candidate division CSSED10-310 bacterium]